MLDDEMSVGRGTECAAKAAYAPMSEDRRLEVVALFTDDVLAALTKAFFEVVKNEHWGKRDLAKISGLNETAIGHILAGRRRNLTAEIIAVLARAMQKRPQLVLHDLRPKGNHFAALGSSQPDMDWVKRVQTPRPQQPPPSPLSGPPIPDRRKTDPLPRELVGA